MARPFRPYAKIPVKISFKSYTRSKNEVWERGFIKIIESGGCIELSDFYKKHASLPIERLYKNKNILRGSDGSPYIFSIRLDANHPENEGQKLIRLNFNGNLEGYEYALKSLNNAFETFSERFQNQAKKLPEFRKEAKKIKNSKTDKNEKRLNTKKNEVQKEVSGAEKASENFQERKLRVQQPNSRSGIAQKLLAAPAKSHSWQFEFDRLLGGPEEAPRKVLDPQEEARLAEIRNRNSLKLEQRRKERAEKRKEKPAERPIQREEKSVLKKKKNVSWEDLVVVKQEENLREKPIKSEDQPISKKQRIEKRKTFNPAARTLLYDFSGEKNLLNVCSVVEVSLDPKEGRLPRKKPVAKRLALRQGSVVKQPSKVAGASSKKPPRKGSEQSLKKSTKPRKRVRQESSSSSKSSSDEVWQARPRGFSPSPSPSPEKPKQHESASSKKESKAKKPQKASRKAIVSYDSDVYEPSWNAISPSNTISRAITPEPASHQDFEAPSSSGRAADSAEDTSGYSSGNRSNSTSSDHPINSDEIKDVKLEPEDYMEVPDSTAQAGQLERKSPENSEKVYRGQHFVGMRFNHTTIINSRLVDCDVQNSTIINCSIEHTSIWNCRVSSQTV